MAVEWKPELTVGVGEIDVQHRKLIGKMQELHDAAEAGNMDTVKETIKFLAAYAENHFRTEEMFMMHYAYPAYKDHKAKHMEYLTGIEILVDRMRAENMPAHEIKKEAESIYKWFQGHIAVFDMKMGDFLKTKMHGL